ncbi:hypothetical protein [Undibacterium sp. Ji22W]|uniref:hypothetical protein n=1 Tax=Undibacterium sp. Ji22W TaxID=3413038 RepID=UPI003BF17822
MKILILFLQASLVLGLCCACKKPAEPKVNTTSGSADSAPAFKIAEQQRQALEQAKQVEQEIAKASETQQKQIEEATK